MGKIGKDLGDHWNDIKNSHLGKINNDLGVGVRLTEDFSQLFSDLKILGLFSGCVLTEVCAVNKAIEVRSNDKLLFKVTPAGCVEYLKDGWLHTVDIAETLRTGKAVVTRAYIGKNNILTSVNICDRIHSN